jgi:uncharacterized protein
MHDASGPATDPVSTAVGFVHTLRAAGVRVGTQQLLAFLEALDALEPGSTWDVYWAGRLTLCTSGEDLDRYDRVFAAYFAGQAPPRPSGAESVHLLRVAPGTAVEGERQGDEEPGDEAVGAAASDVERLRHLDVAALSPTDREGLSRLLAAFRLRGQLRHTRRYRAARRGRVDRPRTVRAILRGGGEVGRLRRESRRLRPRRVVILVDVSGSMSPYAEALLRFAHAAAHGTRGARTEVFTIGTRLTRVTEEMAHRDPDDAMIAMGAAIPDWSGGTKLGALLKEFLDRWGQRGMARGAVIVVLSDGWERGDAMLLGEQMARLARLAHRVVWANPRKGRAGYVPLVAGMAAALPHVDDFVEGHSLAALERLAQVVAGAALVPRSDVVSRVVATGPRRSGWS